MQRSQSFVSMRLRNSGKFTPGFYTKTKINPAPLTAKKIKKNKINSPGLKQFKINLQSSIIENLLAKGGCLRTGVFLVTAEIEGFLKENFPISKRWQTNKLFLKQMGVIDKVYRPEYPNFSIHVTDFQSKFGNSKTLKYSIKVCFFYLIL